MRKAISLLVSLTLACTVKAGDIDIETASLRGREFLDGNDSWHASGRDIGLRKQPLDLAYTAQGNEGVGFYVFNRQGGGYVLVSAYDGAQQILGYSMDGQFDYDQAPKQLKYWLGTYVAQIDYARKNNIRSESPVQTDARNDIKPLIKTLWGQNWPYNLLCPDINTGCVATSMAQIMKYYEWPQTGRGVIQYTDSYGCGKDIYTDLSQHAYDWNHMLEQYPEKFYQVDSVHAYAVAQLFFDCASSVYMSYYGDDGSSANTEDIANALVTYFDYDSCAILCTRGLYSDQEWDNILFNELNEGRPVIYNGFTDDYEGHSFICDGYNSANGMYHFNMGWKGLENNYYKLDAIGKSSIFTNTFDMVTGIQKPTGQKPVPNVTMYAEGDLICTDIQERKWKGKTMQIYEWQCESQDEDEDNMIISSSCSNLDIQLGLKFTNMTTQATCYAYSADYNIFTFNIRSGFSRFYIQNIEKPDLAAGTYHVTPVCRLARYANSKSDEYWSEIRAFIGYKNWSEMSIRTAVPETKAQVQPDSYWSVDGRVRMGLGKGISISNGKKYLQVK